jgi:Nucleotidyl transferase AbiEii toxin, Type IV TA system/WYL domain
VVACYSFNEVFAEKLRALAQRARPRDLYDVVNLHRHVDGGVDRERVVDILRRKCAFKEIPVPRLSAITAGRRGVELTADWGDMLGHQLPSLPPVGDFVSALVEVFAWLEGARTTALPSISRLGEDTDETYAPPPTLIRWGGGAPLEQIRFAGANRLLVDLAYRGGHRLIEPYALRRSRAGDLLLYAARANNGEVRSYRVDRIEGVRVTNRSYRPRYAVELSSLSPVSRGRRAR